MKKILISVLTCAFIGILISLAYFPKTSYASKETVEDGIKLQIPVISDVHICNAESKRKFEKVLMDYNNLAPNYEVISIVGDLTDCGVEEEYDEFNRILNSNIPDAEKIIAMGNHEYFEGRFYKKPNHTDELFINRFVTKTSMPKVYYDKWVSGYHFICLGGEKSILSDEKIGDRAIISEEQYAWLKKVIAQKTDLRKPIFIFLHQPIDCTVYGSEKWGGGLSDGKLYDLLKQYPQAILFSGHSHYTLNHPKTLYQDGFTMLNTGAIHYILKEDDTVLAKDMQGLLINVYDDKVEIKARDFYNNLWINSYTIKLPFENPNFKNKISIKD